MTKAGYAPEKKPEYRLPGQTGIKGIFCFIAEQCNGETERRAQITWLGLAWLGLAWLGSIVMLGLIKRNNIHKKFR
ncbi:hypothetical protein ACTLJB_005229 [Escherichia coli]